VEADAAALPALAAIQGVSWIQNQSQFQELNDDARWVGQGYVPFTTPLYERGLTGAGQVGALADSGLSVYDFGGNDDPNAASCYYLDDGNGGAGGPALAPGPGHRKVVGYTVPAGAIGNFLDESGHGSHTTGSVVGDQAPWNASSPADGQAYAARVFFQDIGTGPGLINPPADLGTMFAEAHDPNGDGLYQPLAEPRTHSNSWGSVENDYSLEASQTDAFMWTHPDFLILFAAGNQGPGAGTAGQPGTAKNVVTAGATENGLADPNSMAYFSSHGPAPLGRLKPTISAPGDRVVSTLAGSACGTAEKLGTSMAAPALQGLALLMRQYLWQGFYPSGAAEPADQRHPSAALLKALLIASGRPMSGAFSDNGLGGSWPSNGQGWGRATADDALYFQGDHRALWLRDEYALDGSAGFDGPGQTRTFTITVGSGQPFAAEPLKVALVWTDYQGLPLAGGALVNDLNLSVSDPAGGLHLGNDPATNDFLGAPELPPLAPDSVNPWEVVYLSNPAGGIYTLTVSAANIGSLLLDPARKQGYALVVNGDLLGRQGQAELEFPAYEVAPAEVGTARIRLSDLDLNADPAAVESATVTITSTTQPAGVAVTLQETGAGSGVFSGDVTLTNSLAGGVELAVAAGDLLRLSYQDADDGRGGPAVAYDTARIAPLPLNFVNPPGAAEPGESAADGNFTLAWSPAEATAHLSHYEVQEATLFSRPLFDDAEGAISTNWDTGQASAPWASDASYQHSGASAFWSGRGDVGFFIETSLTLNHDVSLPAGASSAQLGFYSRYYNDVNDYGYVEVAAGGGPWLPLRRLYADPRLAPEGGRLQYHQLDLSGYTGQPIRVRFRYTNGVASIPPDSPGWWLDDVAIQAGSWQTIARVGPETTQHELTGRGNGQYFYRVRGVYADGSASGWSNVAPAEVTSARDAGGKGQLQALLGPSIRFDFSASHADEGLSGSLKLTDTAGQARIQLESVTYLGDLTGPCGLLPMNVGALELQGEGAFNGAGGATFRVCVQDVGQPGAGIDRFYLTCLTGCAYATSGRAADDIIDQGDIEVQPAPAG
ncbi:MAG: S8 family serine peptidase, partial [Candidatus Promineifilaceae bacterium]